MPSKNVYVAESDLPLFNRAAELAGGMSAAVALGLRLYVTQQEQQQEGREMKAIELEVDEEGVRTRKRFTGRQILRWGRREGSRSRSVRVYETAKGQFAVYGRDDPDWGALSAASENSWEDAAAWQGDWWASGARTLRVFVSVEQMEGELPDELVAMVRHALERPAVEDLDI